MNAMTNFRLLTPPMPLIEQVKAIGGATIELKWSAGVRAGRTEKVDLSPLIGSFKFYRALRKNPKLFDSVHVINDGNAIAWGDDTIDMSATSIERMAEEAMTADDFRSFLKRNQLTHDQAASILGRSRRQIENYLAGGSVPRIVALACYGYEARKSKPRHAQKVFVHTGVQNASQTQAILGASASIAPRLFTKSDFKETSAIIAAPLLAAG